MQTLSNKTIILSKRFKSVTTVLAAKGHNITVVSADQDTSADNIHYIYMDKVYETFYTADDGADELNFFDLGSQNVVSQLLDGVKISIRICSGFVKSSGWEQLSRYPHEFKV